MPAIPSSKLYSLIYALPITVLYPKPSWNLEYFNVSAIQYSLAVKKSLDFVSIYNLL